MASAFYLFGWFLGAAAVALLITSGISALIDPPGVASIMAASALLIGFVGIGLALALGGREHRLVRAHAYVAALVIWFVAPAVLCVPIRFGHEGTTWIGAYSDMVSCFTTTGGVFIHDFKTLPDGLKVWRAVVGWLGGLSSLAFIIVVLAPNKVGGMLLGRRHDPEHRRATQWDQIRRMLTRVSPIYFGATVVLFLAFDLAGVPSTDALVLAMGTLSTSGIQMDPGDLTNYTGAGVPAIAIIGMIAGGFGFLWISAVVRIRLISFRGHFESFAGLAICLIVGLALAIGLYLGGAGAAGLSPVEAVTEGLLTSVSLVTTSGYGVRPEAFFFMPLPFVLFIVAVGGVTISTAGGFKIFRFLAMMAQSRRELDRLLYPHRIMAMRVGDQTYDIQLMKAVWSSFAIYCAAVASLAVVLSYDLPHYTGALAAAVTTMSSAGPLLDIGMAGEPGWTGYDGLHHFTKLAMVIGMVLGRLEILAVLSLINIRLVRA